MNDINHDQRGLGLSWTNLGQNLAGYLATMLDDGDHLIIEGPEIPEQLTPYAQFCRIDGGWRGELSGNTVLAAQHQLGPASLEALELMGWTLPEEGDECPNLWRHEDDPTLLARLAVAALEGDFGVPFPELLTMRAWGPAAEGAEMLGLAASRDVPEDVVDIAGTSDIQPPVEWAQAASSHEELVELVRESVRLILGAEPIQDDDGDFALAHDGQPIYVRVLDGIPIVRIFTRLAQGVHSRRQAGIETGILNAQHPMMKFIVVERDVLQICDIPAMPLAHHHLVSMLRSFHKIRDAVVDDLVTRTQGRKG